MRPVVALAIAALAAACTRVVDAVVPVAPQICAAGSTDPDCAPTVWPIGAHTANSDPWLITHNQVITSMSPNVLVLNFDPAIDTATTKAYVAQVVADLQAGSSYHGYSNASAKPFLNYNVLPIVDLRNVPIPQTSKTALDATALFSTQFSSNYGYANPDASGTYLTLCQLFEKGIVNEVWIQDGGDASTTPRAPLYTERKQAYDSNQLALNNQFICATGSGDEADCLTVECGVTVRMAHLDESMAGGPGCDLYVRGWGIDSMWAALPAVAADANAFLNQDFDTRFGVSFTGWSDVCDYGGTACVGYPKINEAVSTPGATATFSIDPFQQGCGNSQFPSNATFRRDIEQTVVVQSRCEHFGLHDDGDGNDTYADYPPAEIATLDQTYTGTSSCPAGWEIYWRQSMPGYQNQATTMDGTPMPNWWPMLFY